MSDGLEALALTVETSRSRAKRLEPSAQPPGQRLGGSKLGIGGSIGVGRRSISVSEGIAAISRTVAAEGR